MKLEVRWTAEYQSYIEVDSIDDIPDALSEIDIPESDESKYVDMTYEVSGVYDKDDCPVEY